MPLNCLTCIVYLSSRNPDNSRFIAFGRFLRLAIRKEIDIKKAEKNKLCRIPTLWLA